MTEIREFRTFQEMAIVLALNTPHALILDWWRRLDRSIDDYFRVRGLQRPSSRLAIERALEADPQLGPEVAVQVRMLRRFRNVVAHEENQPISVEEAFGYAEAAWKNGWRIATYPAEVRPLCTAGSMDVDFPDRMPAR